jgi:hypothetical protein
MASEITLKDGRVEQTNFNRYQMRRTVRRDWRSWDLGDRSRSHQVILRQPAGAYESFRSTPPRLKQPV